MDKKYKYRPENNQQFKTYSKEAWAWEFTRRNQNYIWAWEKYKFKKRIDLIINIEEMEEAANFGLLFFC